MAKYLNTIAYMGFLVLMSVGMKTVIGQVTETWDFKNPCTTGNDPNRLTYFQHPYNPKKFLMCDELGKVYVVQCLNCDEIEKMTRTYSIQTTWDGQPITHDPISITDQLPINYHASITGNTWRGVAHIPLEYFPPKVSKFNAYAIHGSGNGRTYESLYPVPTGKYTDPDFHKLNYFQPIDFQQIVPDNWSPNYTSPEWDPIIVLG
ncbi:CD033-like protein [Mya arenaria]|uniref:CD033-like protein n=1 Tax=Mya arenaria TaxID=6604 RepID=A0ABY7G8J8_MYAAR|nr:CD033-like protein [Mya arenaria]